MEKEGGIFTTFLPQFLSDSVENFRRGTFILSLVQLLKNFMLQNVMSRFFAETLLIVSQAEKNRSGMLQRFFIFGYRKK